MGSPIRIEIEWCHCVLTLGKADGATLYKNRSGERGSKR